MTLMQKIYLIIPLAPLFGALIAGLLGKIIGRAASHSVTILGVAIAFVLSVVVFQDVKSGNVFEGSLYT